MVFKVFICIQYFYKHLVLCLVLHREIGTQPVGMLFTLLRYFYHFSSSYNAAFSSLVRLHFDHSNLSFLSLTDKAVNVFSRVLWNIREAGTWVFYREAVRGWLHSLVFKALSLLVKPLDFLSPSGGCKRLLCSLWSVYWVVLGLSKYPGFMESLRNGCFLPRSLPSTCDFKGHKIPELKVKMDICIPPLLVYPLMIHETIQLLKYCCTLRKLFLCHRKWFLCHISWFCLSLTLYCNWCIRCPPLAVENLISLQLPYNTSQSP